MGIFCETPVYIMQTPIEMTGFRIQNFAKQWKCDCCHKGLD